MNRQLLLVPSILVAVVAGAPAQSEGPLVGMPAAILVGPGTSSSSGGMPMGQLHRKKAGFQAYSANPAVDAAGDPLFTPSEMFNGGAGPPGFTVDALSIGLDTVHVSDPAGGISTVLLPAGAWSLMAFSVSRTTSGEPDSLIEQEAAASGGAGADIFTYLFPGSDVPVSVAGCFPTDVPQRALDATEMDLAGGAGTGEIASLDYPITLYQSGSPVRDTLPDDIRVFFSVDDESLFPAVGPSLVPSSWFDCGQPSGASILTAQWVVDGGDPQGGYWTTPHVLMRYSQLGLDQHDDVDALAVDWESKKLIFSIRVTGTSTLGQQLQVATWTDDDPACNGAVLHGILSVPATDADGTVPVAQRLGTTQPGEIDGVCVVDPGTQTSPQGLPFATPLSKATAVRGMSSCIYRDDDNPSGPTLAFTVTGLPTVPTSPGDKIQLWVTAPPVLWTKVFDMPVGAGVFGGTDRFALKLAHPSLGQLYEFPPADVSLSAFWVVLYGTGERESSPIMELDL